MYAGFENLDGVGVKSEGNDKGSDDQAQESERTLRRYLAFPCIKSFWSFICLATLATWALASLSYSASERSSQP